MVNTSITVTSGLFFKNREVPGMDPGRAYILFTHYSWLTDSSAGMGPKNTHVSMGVLFKVLDYQDSRDDICSVVKPHTPSARSLR